METVQEDNNVATEDDARGAVVAPTEEGAEPTVEIWTLKFQWDSDVMKLEVPVRCETPALKRFLDYYL